MNSRSRIQSLASIAFVSAVAVGGFFFPLAGFAVALVMAAAIAMTIVRPRSFCSRACPRGKALGMALKPFSRGRPLPPGAVTPGPKRALCGFMMLCVIGNVARLAGSPVALGRFFWGLCVVSLAAGVVVGLAYRPRAWCAVCPMGTLQDTVGGVFTKKPPKD
jgi:polyferredoxin